jgi:hypothetical protein
MKKILTLKIAILIFCIFLTGNISANNFFTTKHDPVKKENYGSRYYPNKILHSTVKTSGKDGVNKNRHTPKKHVARRMHQRPIRNH